MPSDSVNLLVLSVRRGKQDPGLAFKALERKSTDQSKNSLTEKKTKKEKKTNLSSQASRFSNCWSLKKMKLDIMKSHRLKMISGGGLVRGGLVVKSENCRVE